MDSFNILLSVHREIVFLSKTLPKYILMMVVVESKEKGKDRLLDSSRHGSRPMPGCMPDLSEGQPASWPAYAGPNAGPLGAPAGIPAGPCRPGCRPLRRAGRISCRLMPASTPGGSGPQPAWLPAHAGLGAGSASLAPSCQRFDQLLPACMPAWPA